MAKNIKLILYRHLEHMEQREPGVELLCQGHGILESQVCSSTKVDGNEHVLNDHRGLLACAEAHGHRGGTSSLRYAFGQAKTSLADVSDARAVRIGRSFP